MAIGTGLLVFSLVLIVAFQSVVARKRVNSDDSNYDVLVNHLANVKGIERCNIFVDRYFNKSQVVGRMQAKLAKSLPVMSIKHSSRLSSAKYDRKRLYYKSLRKKPRQRPDILNCASGESLLIYFYQPSSQNNFHQSIKWFQDTLVQPASVPKVLVIAVASKPLARYKAPFIRLFRSFSIVDAEILEISKSVVGKSKKKTNGLKRQCSHGFSVHRYNPFTGIYKKQRLTKRVKWFQPKTTNLRGFKLKCVWDSFTHKPVLNNKTFFLSSRLFFQKSKFGTALKSLMNVTYTYDEAYQDLDFSDMPVTLIQSRSFVALKPHLFLTMHIYTPVIFDTYVQVNLSDFLLFFPLILATVLLLNFLSRFSRFNPRTWSPWATFKMLLGLENPTGITGSLLETLLFILISFTGFFFSNEFSEAVTGILNPITVERHFNTFEDIRNSSITMHLWLPPYATDILSGSDENPIVKSKVRYNNKTYLQNSPSYQLVFKVMSKMFYSPNVTVSYPESPTWVRLFDPTIKVNGRTLIKRSGMSELKWVTSCSVGAFSPHSERMSDIYWRFYESGFHNLMNQTAYVAEVNKDIRREYFLKTQRRDNDDDSADLEINFCLIYCGILLLGSSLAILVLIAEILLAPLPPSNNQSGNRVSIEEDTSFIYFEYEFYEYQETASTPTEEGNEGNSLGPIDESSQLPLETPQEETTGAEMIELETFEDNIQEL